MSLIEARLSDKALTSHQNLSSDRDPPKNLTPSEFNALKHLAKNKNTVFQKAYKGNFGVILDKCSYVRVILKILNQIQVFCT